MFLFNKYKYLHVKIASLTNVKLLCHHRSNSVMANIWLCIVSVDYLSGLARYFNVTVSSCGVKPQEVFSGLKNKRLEHWTYMCTFVAFLNIHSFIHSLLLFPFPLGV